MDHPPVKPVFAVGHRGASAYAPENTVAAFDEAIRLGAKAVEFDLRLTADGYPVVLHDDTVNRTTNGSGPVAHLSRFDLLRLDAGSWMHRRFAGTRIPNTIGMHAVRMGDVVGEHTIYYATPGERIEIKHVATNRDTFARGALRAAAFLAGKPAGRYTMNDVLGV
jgi:glycerophosphoryl diester phosphodiesterase